MVKVKEDMTGWVMAEHGVPDSRLTVICQAEDDITPNGKHVAQWLCECNCEEHKQLVSRGVNIKRGNTKSCGCINREKLISYNTTIHRKYNKYDLSGEYGVGLTSNTNKEFYFDLEDYDKIKDYCWFEDITQTGYHSVRTRDVESKKIILMTSLLGCKYYDHINRNPMDNRKCNLRECTHKDNMRNVSIKSNNSSGFIGVGLNKVNFKWKAYIGVNGKTLALGYFKNKDDAIRARLEAEAKYFGKFAPQRHLFEQYGITIQNELEELDELQVI